MNLFPAIPLTLGAPWSASDKGDQELRRIFDSHYTRQTPGSPRWLRPGYNYVLRHDNDHGAADAVFVWWRPKWEDGRPGTCRKDGLRVIECTVFRRLPGAPLASDLIRAARIALLDEECHKALHMEHAGRVEALITGVGSPQTQRRRSKHNKPGHCYRMAGWKEFEKRGGKADVWLWHTFPTIGG